MNTQDQDYHAMPVNEASIGYEDYCTLTIKFQTKALLSR